RERDAEKQVALCNRRPAGPDCVCLLHGDVMGTRAPRQDKRANNSECDPLSDHMFSPAENTFSRLKLMRAAQRETLARASRTPKLKTLVVGHGKVRRVTRTY